VGPVDQTVSMPRAVRTTHSTMLFVTSGHGLADRSSTSVRRPVAQGAALDRCRRSTIITPKVDTIAATRRHSFSRCFSHAFIIYNRFLFFFPSLGNYYYCFFSFLRRSLRRRRCCQSQITRVFVCELFILCTYLIPITYNYHYYYYYYYYCHDYLRHRHSNVDLI